MDKKGVIHRKCPVLTTTTILVYILLTVNLFTLFAHQSQDKVLPAKPGSGKKTVAGKCQRPLAASVLQNRFWQQKPTSCG